MYRLTWNNDAELLHYACSIGPRVFNVVKRITAGDPKQLRNKIQLRTDHLVIFILNRRRDLYPTSFRTS